MDVRTDLCRVHHTVLLNKDVVSNVQREKRHSEKRQEQEIIEVACKTPAPATLQFKTEKIISMVSDR